MSIVQQAQINSCPLSDIDPQDSALLLDPYAYYARLRAEAPVFRDPRTGIVSVSTYDLVLAVNKQPKIFSSEMTHLLKTGGAGKVDPKETAIMAQGLPWVSTMLTADPPAHSRYKKIALKAFTVARVQAMTDYITETVHRLIDEFVSEGRADFKKAFAEQLPSIIVADLLGVPRSDIPQFQIWLRSVLIRLNSTNREERIAAARHEIELQQYMIKMIADRRDAPRDDVISDLVHATLAEEGDPRPLDDAELVGIIHQLFTAGQDSTAHTLTYALYHLIQLPDQLAKAKSDPSLFGNFIEEVIRHLTPTQNMWRIVKQDTELAGVPLRAGEVLLLRYGSANRDGSKFANPDSFDINRPNVKEHLGFGAGIHTCLGMALARREMQIALPILIERLPNLRIAEGTDFGLMANLLHRGVQSLSVEFDPA